MTVEAVRVQPTSDGCCPVLSPGQYCLDGLHGLYHFCAPDGSRFAVNNDDKRKSAAKVMLDLSSASIFFLKDTPTDKCWRRNKVTDCKWIVRNGFWVELTNE